MSRLAHATYAAPGFEAEKRALDATIQHEVAEAQRIRRATGCTWAEAIRLASQPQPQDHGQD